MSMRSCYSHLVNWARSHPAVIRMARMGIRLVPDVPITLNLPGLGRLCFGLRRHRWMLGSDCFVGHARVLGMFRHLTRPGDVFYDVGANIGYYTRFIADRFPVSHIVAFEPMTENLKMLRKNVELGRCADRVTIMPIALAECSRRESLQIDDFGDGSAVLDRVSGGEAAEGRRQLGLTPKLESVEVSRLDDVIEQYGLRPPQVMKIDTEGAEAMVLRGGLQTLRRHRPRLAIALHGPQRVREVLQLLHEMQYVSYGYIGDGTATSYRRLDVLDAERLADNNILASTEEADLLGPIQPLDLSCPQEHRTTTGPVT